MATTASINYIPLDQAARKYGISPNVLRQRVDSGKLAFARLPNGGLLVAEHDIDPSINIKREDFDHLRGQRIAVREAATKYGIPYPLVSRWASAGYIKVLERGWRVFLDEADVAYCAAVYQAKSEIYDGKMQGVPIFDKDGNPFQSQYPEVATYWRVLRQRKRTEAREVEEKKTG